jgi:uncharacterized protein
MLELRPVCENCAKPLPMICTYECTFCNSCVQSVLHNVCPNCGGGFEKRPVRPKSGLAKFPPKSEAYVKQVDLDSFNEKLNVFRSIPPSER